MPWRQVASGTYDRNVNPADGVGSLKQGPRTHPAHAEGRLVYNGANRDGQNGNPDVQHWSVSFRSGGTGAGEFRFMHQRPAPRGRTALCSPT